MNYRTTKLLALKSYTADFSELIDINIADPISRILVGYEGYNSGSGASTHHWAKSISKIELMDGSDVLFSLDGLEAYALQFYQNKRAPSDWLHYLNDNYFHITFALDFGRWLWDPLLALQPARFKNLQLKIENDMDAGGVAPDAAKLVVLASVFDEKQISPLGFLQAKRVKQYTMGSASHEYTDLPTDLPIRKLIVKGLVVGTELCQIIDTLKLSQDNDKRVIFDNTISELTRMYAEENKLYKELFYCGGNTSLIARHVTPSDRGTAIVCGWDSATAAYGSSYGIAGMRTRVITSASINQTLIAMGFNPCSTICIPMGDERDPEDWFDPKALRNLRLDVLSYSGGSTYNAEIIVQQLRSY
jgi:hypothetical protein